MGDGVCLREEAGACASVGCDDRYATGGGDGSCWRVDREASCSLHVYSREVLVVVDGEAERGSGNLYGYAVGYRAACSCYSDVVKTVCPLGVEVERGGSSTGRDGNAARADGHGRSCRAGCDG